MIFTSPVGTAQPSPPQGGNRAPRCVGGGGVEDIEGGPHVWWSPSVSNAVETIRTARR